MSTLTVKIDFVVDTVEELSSIPAPNTFAIVKDVNRGGLFKYEDSGFTPNNGTVFEATIIGSGCWVRQYQGLANVDWFGAVGDDLTDDSAAIQNALNSSVGVEISNKTYYVASQITMGSHTELSGNGTLRTDQDISILYFDGIMSTVKGIRFKGSGKTSGLNNQHGINRNGAGNRFSEREGNMVSDVRFMDLGGAGYYCTISQGSRDTGVIGSSFPYGSTQVVNSYAIDCQHGFFCDERGEYNTFSNCQANGCTNGVYYKGGNNNWHGGQLVGNDTNFRMGAGANGAHCTISGAKINHAINNNILVENTLIEWRFMNCDINVGNITIINSVNIKFINCGISMRGYKEGVGNFDWTLSIADSSLTTFDSCLFFTNGIYSKTGTSTVRFIECKWTQVQPVAIKNESLSPSFITTSASTYSVPTTNNEIILILNGTITTVTLPLISFGINKVTIINSGTGTSVVNMSGATSNIWTSGVLSSTFNLASGTTAVLVNNGTNYYKN